MKAFEAKNNAIQPQYENVIKLLQEAVETGKTGAIETELFSEVVDKLLDDGYDVVKVIPTVDTPQFIITFSNAKEGRKGTYEEKNIISEVYDSLEKIFGKTTDKDNDDEDYDTSDNNDSN